MTKQDQDFIREFLTDNSDIERIELLFPDMNGVLRGKWVPPESGHKIGAGGVRLPISTYALDIWGRDVDATQLAIATGDPDGIAVPIAHTLRRIPWSAQPVAQLLMSLELEGGVPCMIDPRQQLASVLDRFAELRLTPVIAPELEFYLFKSRTDEGQSPSPVRGSEHGSQLYDLKEMADFEPVLNDIRNACTQLGIPADTLIAESGPGQFEINFRHEADALKAADYAIIFKRLVWGCARNHGLESTFMAKPYGLESGSGMHVHISLVDADGSNIFAGTDGVNANLRHAIAGLTTTMREMQAVFAPNMNSYRRFQPDSFAPVSANWGMDNRAATVRVPQFSGAGARLEHRLCGADVNPYLAIAAILGGILIGLEQSIEPDAPIDTGEATGEPLHRNWNDAVEEFAVSKAVGYVFGEEYRRIYTACRNHEIVQLSKQVTDIEYQTYLGRI